MLYKKNSILPGTTNCYLCTGTNRFLRPEQNHLWSHFRSKWYSTRKLGFIEEIAGSNNKLIAFSETGYETIPYASWWTAILLKAIGDHKISYVLVWRNHGYNQWMKKMHYYAPYKDHASGPDFIQFYQQERTLFEKDVAKEKLYSRE